MVGQLIQAQQDYGGHVYFVIGPLDATKSADV